MTQSLEDTLTFWDYAVSWLSPFHARKEIVRDTHKLAKDKTIKKTGATYNSIKDAVNKSQEEYKRLLFYGKIADTADKWTAPLTGVAEAVLLHAGFFPGLISNKVEEFIEAGIKAPFYYKLWKDPINKHKVYWLGTKEVSHSMIPVGSDIVDGVFNSYVETAREIIRDRAKEIVLQKYKSTTLSHTN